MVPEVAFWGFWGLVCVEKWFQNFDLDTQSAIFDTHKIRFDTFIELTPSSYNLTHLMSASLSTNIIFFYSALQFVIISWV